ncbi:MAG: phosphoglucosamine mutase [Balneolales bacterium]
MTLMISVSGIRGIFGSDLTPQNLSLYASAFGTWIEGGTVVVGRDTRVTGALCERIIVSALQSTGCDVINLGIVPTPTVAMGVLQHRASGGIILSASHNPAEWNALKLLNSKSEFLDQSQGEQVIDIARNHRIRYCNYDQIGQLLHNETLLESHIDSILDLPYIKRETIANAKFRVAVDAVNGAGSTAIPRLLERLGALQINKIHCVPDGHFPHNPEPLPEHLDDIRGLVTSTDSDIGFVTDPDADRLAIVDEQGNLLGEEYTQALAFDFMLKKRPGPVVTNLSSSRVTDDIAGKYSQVCHRSAVGEINVVKMMQQTGAVMGGEGNGGVINPDLHYGRDALAGIAMVLQHLAEEQKSASQIRSSMPDYIITKSKIKLDGFDADSVLKTVEETYAARNADSADELKINTADGIKIDFPEGWVHLRKSNTEPIIRIYSEARTRKKAEALADEIKQIIGK